MPDWRSMTDAPYLGCYSLAELPKKEITLTIKRIAAGKIVSEGGKSSKKPVAYFEEEGNTITPGNTVKPMVLNATNCKVLTGLANSTDTDKWVKMRIIVYAGKSTYQGKLVDGLQIRPFLAEEHKTAALIKCESCRSTVVATGGYTAEQIAKMSKDKYNQTLCMACAKAAKTVQESRQEQNDTKEETGNGEVNPPSDG